MRYPIVLDWTTKLAVFHKWIGGSCPRFLFEKMLLAHTFDEISAKIRRHYNSDASKMSLQSEMDSLDLTALMQKHEITDFSLGLKRIVDFINSWAPQSFHGFADDKHKTTYLRSAVMRFEWAQNPLSQLTTS